MEDIDAHIAGLGWAGRFRSVESVCLKGFRYADLFKVVETDGTAFALKLRDAGRGHVAASLACLEAMDDDEGLFVRYTEVRSRDGLWFLLSPWIDGTQPGGSALVPVQRWGRGLPRGLLRWRRDCRGGRPKPDRGLRAPAITQDSRL
jgi:hypothetical protein